MSKAYNLSLLASRNNLGNAGDVFTSTGPDTIPNLSPLSARVTQLNGIQQIPNRIGVNKSTGVVTISAQPSLSELDVPGWDKGQNIDQWSTLQYYLSATAFSNRKIPASAVYVDNNLPIVNSGTNWQGCVLHPNGNVYLVPNQLGPGVIGVYNPTNNTYTYHGNYTTSGLPDYYGGCLGTDGKIYLSPEANTIFRVFDPSSNTMSSIGNIGTTALEKFVGAITGPNGKIYYIPFRQTMSIVFDPSNNTFATIGSFTEGGTSLSKHYGGTLAPNGKIYLNNSSTTLLKIIDTNNNSVQTINDSAGFFTCLAPNGKIYLLGASNSSLNTLVRVLDPNNNSISIIGTLPGGVFADSGYSGGVLSPNGKIYMIPQNNSYFIVIDPSNDTVSSFLTFAGTTWTGVSKYEGAVTLPNGDIFAGTDGATKPIILRFLLNNKWNMNVCTNPFFNKN
jgi:hypothetical protein